MTDEQDRVVARFRRLVKDANRCGLSVVADCGALAVRFIQTELAHGEDIRGLGVAVPIDNACGGEQIPNRDPYTGSA